MFNLKRSRLLTLLGQDSVYTYQGYPWTKVFYAFCFDVLCIDVFCETQSNERLKQGDTKTGPELSNKML